jgi:hypothetical protein
MSTDGTVVVGPDNFFNELFVGRDVNASFDGDKTLIVKNVPRFRQDRFKRPMPSLGDLYGLDQVFPLSKSGLLDRTSALVFRDPGR